MKVAIVETLDGGNTRRIATFSLQNGRAVCDNPTLWKHLLSSGEGTIVGLRGRRFHPDDGIAFLQNLKYQYAGPYLRAQPLDDEGPAAPRSRSVSTKAAAAPKLPPKRAANPERPPVAPKKATSGPRVMAATGVAPAIRPAAAGAPGKSTSKPGPKSSAKAPAKTATGPLGLSAQQRLRLQQNAALLAHAMRGLNIEAGQKYASKIKSLFLELGGDEAQAAITHREELDDYVALTCLKSSATTYPKAWEKAQRAHAHFLDDLAKAELPGMLHHLIYIVGALGTLPEHRQQWLNAQGMDSTGDKSGLAGEATQDREKTWLKSADKTFKKYGLDQRALNSLFKRGDRYTRDAVTELSQGNYGRAEMALKQALLLDPGLSEGRLLLAELLCRMDRRDEARVEFFHLIEADTVAMRMAHAGLDKALIYARIARTHFALAQESLLEGKIREAVLHLEKAVAQMDWIHRQALAHNLGEFDRLQLQNESKKYTALLSRLYGELQLNPRAARAVGSLPKSWVEVSEEV